jgi:hypothetical protein
VRTFAHYIASRHVTHSPRGDFLADSKTLINAGRFPAATCWGDVHRFMSKRNACPEAISEARKLWRSYQKTLTLEEVVS